MQIFENLPPIVGLILGFVLLVWLVFVFLVPFMIEGIRRSSREARDELVELNHKLDELTRYLADSAREADAARGPGSAREGTAARAGGAGRTADPARQASKPAPKTEAGREARRRREPTISETDFESQPRPSRREPRVK
jgi:F0F1-type ATP synthase membrane subunit b/b'